MSGLKLLTRAFSVLGILLAASSVWAVPMQLAHQGRLLDADGSPLEGDHTLTFTLFDAATDGATVWTEDIQADIVGGFYSAILGADEGDNPLDDLVLGGGRVWLELAVDGGDPLTPRHELVSVPYAVMAGTATNVDGGYVDAAEVAIAGTTVIDSTGAWVGPTPAIDYGDLTGVPDATAPAWDELTGVPDGLLDGEDADTLAGLSCADAARPRWDEALGSWACDGVTWGELQGIPAGLADGDGDALAGLSCADGGVAKFDLAGGVWICGTDAVLGESEVLAFVDGAVLNVAAGSSMAGAGLATVDDLAWASLSGVPPEFADGLDADSLAALGLSCADGDRPSWNLFASEWVCAPDADTDTVLTEAEVEDFILDEPVDLPADSTLDGEPISTGSGGLFGGTGADGPLVISSGTTTLDIGGAAYFVRNYTSIEISGTGQLNFVNPNDNGTIIILRSQGDVELSSSSPSIDASGMGGQPTGTRVGRNNLGDAAAAGGVDWYLVPVLASRQVRVTTGSAGAPASTYTAWQTVSEDTLGGAGGGALWMEVGGALDFSGSVAADGLDGMDAATGCAGGAGGGSGGQVVILYNELTSDAGVLTNAGGAGGDGDWSTCTTVMPDWQWVNNRMPGGWGASGLGGSGGVSMYGSPCPMMAAYGGGGGAGGGTAGANSACTSAGAAGGGSDNNIIVQNTVFP